MRVTWVLVCGLAVGLGCSSNENNNGDKAARKAAAPSPRAVPLLSPLRVGSDGASVAKVLRTWEARGMIRKGSVKNAGATDGKIEADLTAVVWQGRQLAVKRGEVELKIRNGLLRKVEAEAKGFEPPASFTKQNLAPYVQGFNPGAKLRVSDENNRLKLEAENDQLDVELVYDRNDAELDIEVELRH